MKRYLIVWLFVHFCIFICGAQDLSEIAKSKPFEIRGSLSAGGEYISTDRYGEKENLFLYSLAGNINVKLYGISIPVSGIYSNQRAHFNQPFQRLGASPKYKWITAHVGYRNVHFSDFTLSGRTLLGYGLVLTPGNWKIGFMHGKVQNLSNFGSLDLTSNPPIFDRRLTAFTVGYEGNNSTYTLNVLKGTDKYNKVRADSARTSLVFPEANLVLTLKARQKITNFLFFEGEGAGSVITRNLNSNVENDEIPAQALISSLIKTNGSSQLNYAAKAGLFFNFPYWSFSANYKKVMPDFRSMGSYFFDTDVEEYGLQASANLLKGRINLAGNMGKQHNNLTERRLQTSNRLLLGGNARFTVTKSIQIQLNYSNNRVDLVNVQTDRLYLDSFNLQQQNNQYTANIFWNRNKVDFGHTVSASYNYNTFTLLSLYDPTVAESFGNNSTNLTLAYNYKWKPQKLNAGLQFFHSNNNNVRSSNSRIGGTASVSKALLKEKLSVRLSMTLNTNKTNKVADGITIRNAISASWTPHRNHGFTLVFDRVTRNYKVSDRSDLEDFRSSVRYTYSF